MNKISLNFFPFYSKFYNLADKTTEFLIYCSIIWGPWAFGTVHHHSIAVMNGINFLIGFLLFVKLVIRSIVSYYPDRWTASVLGTSVPKKYRIDHLSILVLLGSIYMFIYVTISICNPRSTFDSVLNTLIYETNYIKILPTTYNRKETIQSLLNFIGLFFTFWGVRDWLLTKTSYDIKLNSVLQNKFCNVFKSSLAVQIFPQRLKRITWLICINGAFLALCGIFYKQIGNTLNFNLFNKTVSLNPDNCFGPFIYRSNGATFLNMVIPVSIAFLFWMITNNSIYNLYGKDKSLKKYPILVITTLILLVASFSTQSRGGIFSLIIVLVLYLLRNFRGQKNLSIFYKILLMLIFLVILASPIYLGLVKRIHTLNPEGFRHETSIVKANKNDIISYKFRINKFDLPKSLNLFSVADSQNPSFVTGKISCSLLPNNILSFSIHDISQKSSLIMSYTNLVNLQPGKIIDLKFTRNASGLQAFANNKILLGYETQTGANPPAWNHPIIPNEIFAKVRSSFLNEDFNFRGNQLVIKPLSFVQSDSRLNDQEVEISLDTKFNLLYLESISQSRYRLYLNSIQMVKDNWLFGCGLGSWSAAYFLYHDLDETWEAWAHNDLIQYLICLGLAGMLPCILMVFLSAKISKPFYGFKLPKFFVIGVDSAIASCFIHSLVDFPLHVYSICHFLVILLCIRFNSLKL